METAQAVLAALRAKATRQRAIAGAWFFKTGKGEYGEGDRFLGVTVPDQRKISREYKGLPLPEVLKLLHSQYHEDRLTALFIMVLQFKHGDTQDKKKIYSAYMKNTQWINNWDLVDSSASYIVGEWLYDKPRDILFSFARSKNLWKRRIAVLAAGQFIRKGDFMPTFVIAEMLLNDMHDLIHKAVGWMLRVVGDYDRAAEELFLKKHLHRMPRTMLRYAIEKFPEAKRQQYLQG